LKPGGILVVTEPRACFDLDQLMTFAEESLRAKGPLPGLAADWQRIQTVAPLIRDTVRDSQSRTPAGSSGGSWHAEAILDIMRRDGFSSVTFRESHLGNCATITAKNPG